MKTYKPGDKLCACTLLVKCGEGSYGEVWLAENAIGGKVALKILKKKFSEREIRGLQNYKDCDHPNLLKIRHIEISVGVEVHIGSYESENALDYEYK